MKTLIYDCEIIKCIPHEHCNCNFQYCAGWTDYENMGISLIGAWLSWDNSIRIYPQSAFDCFQKAVNQADLIVGFNSLNFDDNLCKANNITIETDYDLLAEVWAAAGMPRCYTRGSTRPGYKLENLAQTNLGKGKSGSGELAPVLWQSGEQWSVVDYLVDDVLITKKLFDKRSHLIDPTNGDILCLREPDEPIYTNGARFSEMPSDDELKLQLQSIE